MSKQESIEEIKNFLIHIQPRVGEGAFAHVWECVEYLERASVVQPALLGEAATTEKIASERAIELLTEANNALQSSSWSYMQNISELIEEFLRERATKE